MKAHPCPPFLYFLAFSFLSIPNWLLAQDALSGTGVPGVANTQNYVLRPSDSIQVQVFQEADLTRNQQIQADGMVHLALINPFRISGLTISQAQDEISRRYYDEEFLWNPRVSVTVTGYSPRKVSVLGEVARPGFVRIAPDRPLSLVEAISSAGGFTRAADKMHVQLKRMDARGQLVVFEYDANQIVQDANIADIPLQDADIISVPELREKVNVIGHVGRPGYIPIPSQETLTLVGAISGAGGFTRLGNQRKVLLLRKDQQGNTQAIEVDVTQILDGSARDIRVTDGDTIRVPEKRI